MISECGSMKSRKALSYAPRPAPALDDRRGDHPRGDDEAELPDQGREERPSGHPPGAAQPDPAPAEPGSVADAELVQRPRAAPRPGPRRRAWPCHRAWRSGRRSRPTAAAGAGRRPPTLTSRTPMPGDGDHVVDDRSPHVRPEVARGRSGPGRASCRRRRRRPAACTRRRTRRTARLRGWSQRDVAKTTGTSGESATTRTVMRDQADQRQRQQPVEEVLAAVVVLGRPHDLGHQHGVEQAARDQVVDRRRHRVGGRERVVAEGTADAEQSGQHRRPDHARGSARRGSRRP